MLDLIRFYRNQKDGTLTKIGLMAGTAPGSPGITQAGTGFAARNYYGNGLLIIFTNRTILRGKIC